MTAIAIEAALVFGRTIYGIVSRRVEVDRWTTWKLIGCIFVNKILITLMLFVQWEVALLLLLALLVFDGLWIATSRSTCATSNR